MDKDKKEEKPNTCEASKEEESNTGEAPKEESKSKEEEYLEGWKRAKADYVNLKKEMETEKQKAMFYSKLIILADLLPIVGNLQKATSDLESNKEVKENSWATGFIHIAKQFDGFLEEKGIKRIQTKGEMFDPALHEAIDRDEKTEEKSGTIIKEVEPGYTLNNEVIAPSKVIVAK